YIFSKCVPLPSLLSLSQSLLPPPLPNSRRQSGSCDTGSTVCCTSLQSSSTTGLAELAGLLGISLGSITPIVGLSCSPLNILGLGGNSCSAQPACCSNNSFGGLLALGCNPLNLNL
ncbi:fungal hydrophobin-domain-containing protein, partial [Flammula alnicola]